MLRDYIKKIYDYILRDDLDIRHKLVNMLLMIVIGLNVPVLLLTLFLSEKPGINVAFQSIVLVFVVISLWQINKNHNSEWPLIALAGGINFVIFPIMYFTCGGYQSGMIVWLCMGGISIWLLLDKDLSILLSIIDIIIIMLLPVLEYNNPQWVIPISSEITRIINIMASVIIVSIGIGIMFKYQHYAYERQRAKLLEQEQELNKINRSLSEANSEFTRLNEELERTNEQLKAASEAKSNFLANMSHEIRTPINAVLGMDEMILRESKDDQISKYASDIDSAGHQLLAIVNDILDFSKIESGKMEIHPAEYELYSMMNDCYNMIRSRAEKKDLELILENDPMLPSYLIGDEVRVRQIVMNLLTNAVKYTKDGFVKLSFSFEKCDEDSINLVIAVKDSGIGISEENIEKLFLSFERIDEVRNRNIEGTGLGLSITQSFVNLMGGKIDVQSKLHAGSVFTVIIPQEIASKQPMGDFAKRFNKKIEKSASKKGSFTAPDAKILVVDDVKMNLNVVRLLLKNTKIAVDMANSGSEGLSMSMMKKYDVILMDIMMPEMDGVETLKQIRKAKMGLNRSTPIVALTANAVVGAEETYKKEGFIDYLTKPIKGEAIEEALIKYIPEDKVIIAEGEEDEN